MTEPRADHRHDGEVDEALPPEVVISPTGPPATAGFGSLAHTIRRRTTDLIAIAIVLVAGLTFGRQVLRWWNTDAEDLAPTLAKVIGTAEVPWNEPGHPVDVEFGDSNVVLRRERLVGDTNEAITHLVERCVVVLEGASAESTARRATATEAETRLLEAASKLDPVRSAAGRWSIYVTPTPQPTAIGVVEEADATEECAACGARRVVCWGVLMGGERNGWTAFWFERRLDASAGTDGGPITVDLPSGAQRTLSLRDPNGEGVVAFRGPGQLRGWRDFFERSLTADGRRIREWVVGDDSAMARFRSDIGHDIDVRIVDRGTELTGLMTIGSPPDGDDSE